jgi:ER degradation enhancer, mannosidase alpha-like 2
MHRFALAATLMLFTATGAAQDAADSVRTEFLHAWNCYRQYAWGYDELQPLSRTGHNWYGASLCMTPVDAYDTMILMGLENEAAEAKRLILDSLSFNRDMEVQAFEVIIRLVGGLLSAYQIDGDRRLLDLADDLGTRLLPIFASPTGMPYRYVNLRTGATRDSLNNPAEIGTSLLEFGMLSRLTGKPVYYEKARNAVQQLFARRSSIGLVGSVIDVASGAWVKTSSHTGGGIDSYYEYLLKASILFDDAGCRSMWEQSIAAVNTHLARKTRTGLWYGRADMNSGKNVSTRTGALEGFLPAVLVLGGDTTRARDLMHSFGTMWMRWHAAPEGIDFSTMKLLAPSYELRPEVIESAYYLYAFTGNEKYRSMGSAFLHDLRTRCRTDAGYAALRDVTTGAQSDIMESFFLAETLKYLYLLLAPPETLHMEGVIFNTEAHPLRRGGAE